jgi:hypothetical protein
MEYNILILCSFYFDIVIEHVKWQYEYVTLIGYLLICINRDDIIKKWYVYGV